MKPQGKSEAQIESEKRETAELVNKILSATNRIPKKIINEGSYQAAVAFKQAAESARKAAESKQPRLSKLRDAWTAISPYYAQQ